jgi:hypothetical protein
VDRMAGFVMRKHQRLKKWSHPDALRPVRPSPRGWSLVNEQRKKEVAYGTYGG